MYRHFHNFHPSFWVKTFFCTLATEWDLYLLGAIDGKHIIMHKPWRAGSEFYNYKAQQSIVLMAMCDHNYR